MGSEARGDWWTSVEAAPPVRFPRNPWWLVASWLAVIGLATLLPGSRTPGSPVGSFSCILCGERGTSDFLLNVALFLPLGGAIALAGGIRAWALAPALLSLGIEVGQVWVPGRDPALGDLLANTLGGIAGFTTVRGRHRLARIDPLLLGFVATALASGVPLLTTLLLRPTPPDTVYFGQWMPDIGLERYAGTVRDARIGGVAVPPRRLTGSERLAGLLRRGAPIEVDLVAGPRPPGLAPVFSVYDHRRREVLLVGVAREDLVFRQRTLAVALRLDRPETWVRRGAAPLQEGERHTLRVEPAVRGTCIHLDDVARCGVAPSASRGWALLLYASEMERIGALLDFLWLASVGGLVGLAWGWRREAVLAALVLAAAALLAGLPWWASGTGLLPLAGLAAGGLAGARVRRRLRASPPAGLSPAA